MSTEPNDPTTEGCRAHFLTMAQVHRGKGTGDRLNNLKYFTLYKLYMVPPAATVHTREKLRSLFGLGDGFEKNCRAEELNLSRLSSHYEASRRESLEGEAAQLGVSRLCALGEREARFVQRLWERCAFTLGLTDFCSV